MITLEITSGQRKQLLRVIEDAVDALELSKEQAKEILKVGNLLQADLKASLISHSINERCFVEVADLGTIIVSGDYVHGNQLGMLNRSDFDIFSKTINDSIFSSPSRILKPGDKIWVRIFMQVGNGANSEKVSAFLKSKDAFHLGAQGISLVWREKRALLPKGHIYFSLDIKEKLPKDSSGEHMIPMLSVCSEGDYGFDVVYYDHVILHGRCFFCFTDPPNNF